jgi:NAD(P)-dependent dehydrogenase (short-subunit alcohol dehydrogenase family)
MSQFQGKTIVITGAGSGIGRALACSFATQGARLALSDINAPELAETIALLPNSCDARAYELDVSSRAAVFAHADQVLTDFGTAHYVFNNAGTSTLASFEDITIEEIEKIININLWGVIYGTKAFLPQMVKQREGCIINTSSVFGLLATPCSVAYTISKFGVRALTETLWQELPGSGVRAVLVHPGGINTNIPKNSIAPTNESATASAMMAANVRQMTTSPETCAREIIAGIIKGKKRILVGNGSTMLHLISRLFPDSYGRLINKKLGYKSGR